LFVTLRFFHFPNQEARLKRLALLLILLVVPVAVGQSPRTTSVKVYFSNDKLIPGGEDCTGKVFPVTRTVPKTAAVARAALEQLLGGPTESEKAKGYWSWFNDETKSVLLGVKVKSKTAYVNFKDLTAFYHQGNATTSCGSTHFLAQLDKTLMQFPGIKRVFYAIEGDPEAFYGWLQFDCPEALKNCDKTNFK
jgi:spore germination protein GerM